MARIGKIKLVALAMTLMTIGVVGAAMSAQGTCNGCWGRGNQCFSYGSYMYVAGGTIECCANPNGWILASQCRD